MSEEDRDPEGGEGDEQPFSDLMLRWLAQGDGIGSVVSGAAVEGKDGDGGGAGGALASDLEDPHLRPVSWAEPPSDSRRFQYLIGGAAALALALILVVSLGKRAPEATAADAPRIAAAPPRTAPASVQPARRTISIQADPLVMVAGGAAAAGGAGGVAPVAGGPAAPAQPATAEATLAGDSTDSPPTLAVMVASAPAGGAPSAANTGAPEAPSPPAPAPTAVVPPAAAAAPAAKPKPPSHLQLCRTAVARSRAEEAALQCKAAVAAAPKSPNAIVLLARAELLRGRARDSVQLARQALAMNPSLPEAYLLIGSVEQNSGHPRDARAAYETYLKLAPSGKHAAEVREVLRRL